MKYLKPIKLPSQSELFASRNLKQQLAASLVFCMIVLIVALFTNLHTATAQSNALQEALCKANPQDQSCMTERQKSNYHAHCC